MKKLLLIEDDRSVRESLVRLLKIAGFECMTAGCVADALVKYEANPADAPFCAILVDGWLPDAHGTQFVAELRKRHPGGIPPVVANTASCSPTDLESWSAVGVAAVHRKGLDMAFMLLDTLKRVTD